METMEEGRWNDARLDDLNGHVTDLGRRMEQGFARADRRMDQGFARADRRMDEGFARVDVELRDIRSEMNARFEHVEARFDALNRTMLQLGGGAIAALVGLIATQL
jgi:hypothetical protein